MRKALLTVCLTLLLASPLLGHQPEGEYQFYLAITTGGTFFSAPSPREEYWILDLPSDFGKLWRHSRIDSTYTVGFRFGYKIAPQWDLETCFHYSPTHQRIRGPLFSLDKPGGYQRNIIWPERVWKLDVYRYLTNLSYYFVQKSVQPFLTAGMGGVTFNGDRTATTTNFAINMGGGVKFRPKKRLRVSFDLKDLIIFNQYLFNQTRNNLTITLAVEFLF